MDPVSASQSNLTFDTASSSSTRDEDVLSAMASSIKITVPEHIHKDSSFDTSVGVTYPLFYLGRVTVYRSLRKMTFDQRYSLTQECIVRVRRALGRLNTNDNRYRVDDSEGESSDDTFMTERDDELISKKVELANTGTAMIASITLDHLTLIVSSSGKTSAYEMGTVSFAMSTGYHHSAFVLKHPVQGDVCLVFRSDRAEDARNFVATLSQAFNLRFKRYLYQEPATSQQHKTEAKADAQSGSFYSEEQAEKNSPNSKLFNEPWYHHKIDREMAEQLVVHDGDFLVRDSSSFRNQYVLTGKEDGRYHHLLLVDEDGQVRSSVGKVFTSVADFVKYHQEHKLRVVVKDGCVMLKNPIFRDTYY